MTEPTPDQVEAGAKAIYAYDGLSWKYASESQRDKVRGQAHAAIAAALRVLEESVMSGG